MFLHARYYATFARVRFGQSACCWCINQPFSGTVAEIKVDHQLSNQMSEVSVYFQKVKKSWSTHIPKGLMYIAYIHYYMFVHVYGKCSLWQEQQVRDVWKLGMPKNSQCKVSGLSLKQRKMKPLLLKTTHPCAMIKLSVAYHSRWSYLSGCRWLFGMCIHTSESI